VSVVGRLARRRWSVVLCGIALLCVLPAVRAALPVPGSDISAQALRARILASARLPYQGYAESTVDFGLPVLPDLQGVSRLFDRTTDQEVWYLSPGHWRADGLSAVGESDVYQVCRVTYLWDYTDNLLTRIVGAQPVRLPRSPDLLPPALARRLLGLASPADHISRLPSLRVAGVDAAGLRLVPADPATTIGAIDIWADPADGLPVEVRIMARGVSRPVLVASFLELSQRRPAFATVIPHPSPGVDVVTARLSSLNGVLNGDGDGDRDGDPFPASLGGLGRIQTPGGLAGVAAYGTGFSRLVLLPLPGTAGSQAVSAASRVAAAISLPGGTGLLIRTPLLTVLLATTQRFGRTFLFTGAVTPALLEHAASDLLARLHALFTRPRPGFARRT
jgi:hypothetical protein